jgi:hypothetical protein
MKGKINWKKIIFITGVAAMIIGAIDPMEGSVVIVAGSALLALSTYFLKDRDRNLFLAGLILIALGVYFLFYFSILGGIGGKSRISIWWGYSYFHILPAGYSPLYFCL